jgi:hypothetical protein
MTKLKIVPPRDDRPLDDRLAAAFGDAATSDVVIALIEEVDSAALDAGVAAEQARERAMDPALGDASAARREMEDAAFTRDQLQAAVSRLRERLTELRGAEEDDRRRAAYEEARAERDELAAELARVYPPLAAQLADLLGRLRASDDRIEHMNANALPRGCGPLLVAELVARGLDGLVQNSVDVPRIVRRVQLPAFEYDIHAPYAWPRSSSVDAGGLMFRAVCELGSRSA